MTLQQDRVCASNTPILDAHTCPSSPNGCPHLVAINRLSEKVSQLELDVIRHEVKEAGLNSRNQLLERQAEYIKASMERHFAETDRKEHSIGELTTVLRRLADAVDELTSLDGKGVEYPNEELADLFIATRRAVEKWAGQEDQAANTWSRSMGKFRQNYRDASRHRSPDGHVHLVLTGIGDECTCQGLSMFWTYTYGSLFFFLRIVFHLMSRGDRITYHISGSRRDSQLAGLT